jgi:hypothetical protein
MLKNVREIHSAKSMPMQDYTDADARASASWKKN